MFIYANNVLKDSKAARSRQVLENEKAFKKILCSSFNSISTDDFLLSKIFKNESNIFRKIFFHFYFFLKVFFINRKTIIYSRNLSIVYLSSKLGFSVVWEAHDLPKGNNIKILKSLINKVKIITISDALRNKIISDFEINHMLIYTAHDGVDMELYDQFRNIKRSEIKEKYNIPLNTKVILHSGSIMKERGSFLFKDVLAVLPDWLFVQVGGNLSDINYLKNDLKSFSNFMAIPHQDNENLIKIQLSCDALFYMITKETSTYWCCSPMKIFEYFAAGKPIVASNIGSLNEILNDKVAYLYDPENKESLKASLIKLNQEANSSALAINAVEHVRANFTWDIRAKKILNFLEIKA